VEIGASRDDSTEYVVVLIFDTFENFKAWEVSPEVGRWFARIIVTIMVYLMLMVMIYITNSCTVMYYTTHS
jgi:hypothetical protein